MMKNYYQLLGLDIDASIADVEEKYQILTKEFDPSIHEDDLKDYFKLELEKVQDAYSKILLNHKKEGLDTFLNEDRDPILFPKTISDSYKLLKLKEDATLGEITNGYKILIEEFNPDYQSEELKEFFKKEQEKVTNSYKKIIIYLSTLNVEKENDSSEENDSINNKDTEDSDNINISEDIDFESIEDSNSESVKVKLKESDEILVLTKEEWSRVINNNEAHLYEVLYDMDDNNTQQGNNNQAMFKNLFSPNGRIRRLEYGLRMIFFYIYAVIAQTIAFEIDPYDPNVPYYLIMIPAILFNLIQSAKRCHDRGNSGWYQIIPFYGLWLLFGDGDKNENDYGSSPKG